jgi:3'(2'), 5'-bisphosphate nucleotidase
LLHQLRHTEILALLQEAAGSIMQFYHRGQTGMTLKADRSPVTEADLASHEVITRGLASLHPEIPVLSEESSHEDYAIRSKHLYMWLLDPLDGTKEFLKRTDEFSINLALISEGQVVAGYIHLPVWDKVYFAQKGQGAFELSDGKLHKLAAAHFSLQDSGLRVVASRSHLDDLTKTYIDQLVEPTLLPLGSALKFISIATGEAHYYPRMVNIMEWDTAAGQILIEEAGGSMVDASTGRPLVYNKPDLYNPYFIASGIQL